MQITKLTSRADMDAMFAILTRGSSKVKARPMPTEEDRRAANERVTACVSEIIAENRARRSEAA